MEEKENNGIAGQIENSIKLSMEEVEGLKRIAGDKNKFTDYIEVYRACKMGLKGGELYKFVCDRTGKEANPGTISTIKRMVFKIKENLGHLLYGVGSPVASIIKTKLNDVAELGLTKEKIAKGSLRDNMQLFAMLFDKMRLLEGQSTQNIAIATSDIRAKALEEVEKKSVDIEKKLAKLKEMAKERGIEIE